MTLLRTRRSAARVGGSSSRPNDLIALTCFWDIAESVGSGVDPEKYNSFIMEISSLSVADKEGSLNASSSSSELSESTDSKGFLKLSTVSQNCTSKERLRLSINSMKYERELGLVNISRKDKRVVVGGSGNVDEVACESRLE